MNVSSVTSNSNQPLTPLSVQPSQADTAKFAKMMSTASSTETTQSTASATGTEEETPDSSAVTDEQLWAAVYQGFTDSIIRSGIRRTVNNINELKRLYREEM